MRLLVSPNIIGGRIFVGSVNGCIDIPLDTGQKYFAKSLSFALRYLRPAITSTAKKRERTAYERFISNFDDSLIALVRICARKKNLDLVKNQRQN